MFRDAKFLVQDYNSGDQVPCAFDTWDYYIPVFFGLCANEIRPINVPLSKIQLLISEAN